jgi:UDP-sulfoquinovose synthase
VIPKREPFLIRSDELFPEFDTFIVGMLSKNGFGAIPLMLRWDGYLGWPTAMHLARRGMSVTVVDNLSKRRWEKEIGVRPLYAVASLLTRVERWNALTDRTIQCYIGDLTNADFVDSLIAEVLPDAVVHFGEQPSAPYSMRDREHAVFTQVNNVVGTLNLVFALYRHAREAHVVKLGTMGEYGTPDIDIEEGYLHIRHNGREDRLPYPKQPPSFYHLSKVHDSHNLFFVSKVWKLRVTDLNQGVVYGVSTPETQLHPDLATSFHYDSTFGTVLNRFLVQAACGVPLTVYGQGGQKRGFLNILDTLQCIELACLNPATPGDMRVYNQFTEQFTVRDLAERVKHVGQSIGLKVEIASIPNPRVEKEFHYYNAAHTHLIDLGLVPHLLTDEVLQTMLTEVTRHIDNVDPEVLHPSTWWAPEPESEPMTR